MIFFLCFCQRADGINKIVQNTGGIPEGIAHRTKLDGLASLITDPLKTNFTTLSDKEEKMYKLDGVGPVNKRPSTKKLYHLVIK